MRKLMRRLKTLRSGATHGAAADGGDGDKAQQPYVPVEIKNYQWTSSFIEREKIYGMEKQVKDVVDHLVETTSFATVGIVGMQGSGKTALAQKVFTEDRVLDKFALRLWVCVSPHCCERKELLMRVLDSIGLDLDEVRHEVEKSRKEEVGVLLFILSRVLLDNSYLIVFDDVRSSNEKDDAWFRDLSRLPPMDQEWTHRLAYGLPKYDDPDGGSAVIVTSRREDMARAIVGSKGLVHRMKPLQDELLEDGWAVFTAAFHDEAPELTMDPEWKKMKRLIVEKCNGLPLALKVAGQKLASRELTSRKSSPKEIEEATPGKPDAVPQPDAAASNPAPIEAPRIQPDASALISADATLGKAPAEPDTTPTQPDASAGTAPKKPLQTDAPQKAPSVEPDTVRPPTSPDDRPVASPPTSPDASPVASPPNAATQADTDSPSDDGSG